MKIGIYFGEEVEVLFKRKKDLYIRYEDGVEEFVPIDEVTQVKTKKLINTERKLEQFEKHFGSVERVNQINTQPCIICGKIPSENMHVISRSAGGTWEDIIPACHQHHAEQHLIGIKSFQEKYQLNLTETAKFYAEKFPVI